MSVPTQAWRAVFGETVVLPAGIGILVAGCAGVRAVLPGLWEAAGGVLLLAGAIGLLAVSVRRST